MDEPTLGKRLQEARKQAGLTQQQVAKALGVTYQAVSNYERGKCNVEDGVFWKLCILYRVRASQLLDSPVWSESQQTLFSAAEDRDRLTLYELWGVPADREVDYRRLISHTEDSAVQMNGSLRETEQQLIHLFRQIPEGRRAAVLELLQAALKLQG